MTQDIDDLIARLEYHGKHCLDRNGEQSAIMLAAIAALRAQRDKIARLADAISFSEAKAIDRAIEAEAERDAAMKDAERYRWLRACRAGDWDALNNLRLAQSMCGLDTAIDAAIAKGKG